MFPGDDHRELFSSFGWIFFSPRCTGSFLLHIHCSVPCQELKIDCGPQSKLSVCAALIPLSVLSLLSLPRLLSVSTQRVHWVLPAPPSLRCCLESICRQFVGEIPGLPSSVVSSPRDHSFIAWCSMSSKPVFYLLFTSSRRANPFCFSIWGRNRAPICIFLNFYFYWRIIALQYCVGFCHTSPWINISIHMSPPSWTSLPFPTALDCHRELGLSSLSHTAKS